MGVWSESHFLGMACAKKAGIENNWPGVKLMPSDPQTDSSVRTHSTLPQEIKDLVSAVSELPPEMAKALDPVVQRVVESTRRRKRILSLVQEALSQLRLDTKYLMFDLESTRRERDALQEELDFLKE